MVLAFCGYFPIDDETLNYMRLTNRDEEHIQVTEAYTKANHLFYDPGLKSLSKYTKIVEIDLSSIKPSIV